MKVERKDDEILIRFSAGMKTSKIQSILDHLRYEALTSQSEGTQEDADQLTTEAKKGRWEKTKRDLGLNDSCIRNL